MAGRNTSKKAKTKGMCKKCKINTHIWFMSFCKECYDKEMKDIKVNGLLK